MIGRSMYNVTYASSDTHRSRRKIGSTLNHALIRGHTVLKRRQCRSKFWEAQGRVKTASPYQSGCTGSLPDLKRSGAQRPVRICPRFHDRRPSHIDAAHRASYNGRRALHWQTSDSGRYMYTSFKPKSRRFRICIFDIILWPTPQTKETSRVSSRSSTC